MDPDIVDADTGDNPYLKLKRTKILFISLLSGLCFICALASLGTGAYHIGLWETLMAVLGQGQGNTEVIIWEIRMPRIIAAILVGSALAVSGAVMQCTLKNPLASPYTLGISNAAAFGAAFALMMSYWGIFAGSAAGGFFSGIYGMSACAFLFSMVAVGVLILLSKVTAVTPEAMILMGVAMSAIFSAALSSLQYFADDSTLASMVFWQFGDLAKAGWNELAMLFMVSAPVILYFFWKRWDYNAMDAGEDVARSLGINTKGTRMMGMILASVVTAMCVSIVGIIGFVGLLGPHIVKRVIGNDNRYLIPASMLLGTLILICSDYLGRMAFAQVIPVGIITSFLGGPLFIYILIRGYRRNASSQ